MARKKAQKPEAIGPVEDTSSTMDVSDAEVLKSDEVGFRGGLDVDLSREMASGLTLEKTLSSHITDELSTELRNHTPLCQKIEKWERQYKGRKRAKSKPWPNSANVAVPVTRYGIDTILVRILDAIFNRRKVVLFRAMRPELVDLARKMEDSFDWFQRHILRLRDKLMSPIIQQLKIGTGIVHVGWESRKRTIYRYATQEEEKDSGVKKYKLSGTRDRAVKDVQTLYEGPQVFPVPREDFIISSDADQIESAYMCGFRKQYRKFEVELKAKQGKFRKEAVAKLLSPDKPTETAENRVEMQNRGTERTRFSEPYTVWHLWLRYDVDEDGDQDDILVGFHLDSGQILYCQYNPIFTGNRPFVKFVGSPTQYAFDGEGMCEAMYSIQEEIDTIHNQRLDRMSLLNSFVTMSREGSGLDNFKWDVGRHYVVADTELEQAFRVVPVPEIAPSSFQEEGLLHTLSDKLMGTTPAVMGISTAERPVFKDTMAHLEEANKKFKNMIDNIRNGITELVYQLLELFAQYQPELSYQVEEGGEWKSETVDLSDIAGIRDGVDIELAASTEVLSQEVRRQINLEIYTMLSDYYTKSASVVQALVNPAVPPGFKKYLLDVDRASSKVLTDILRDFDRPDAEDIVVSAGETVPQEAMQPPPPMAPPGETPQGGMPPGGMPQGGMPPGGMAGMEDMMAGGGGGMAGGEPSLKEMEEAEAFGMV